MDSQERNRPRFGLIGALQAVGWSIFGTLGKIDPRGVPTLLRLGAGAGLGAVCAGVAFFGTPWIVTGGDVVRLGARPSLDSPVSGNTFPVAQGEFLSSAVAAPEAEHVPAQADARLAPAESAGSTGPMASRSRGQVLPSTFASSSFGEATVDPIVRPRAGKEPGGIPSGFRSEENLPALPPASRSGSVPQAIRESSTTLELAPSALSRQSAPKEEARSGKRENPEEEILALARTEEKNLRMPTTKGTSGRVTAGKSFPPLAEMERACERATLEGTMPPSFCSCEIGEFEQVECRVSAPVARN